MNKHILDTRLKSIAHYAKEIELQTEAIKVTEGTLEELINSLREVIEFEDGDIIMRERKVRLYHNVKEVQRTTDGDIRFYLNVQYPQGDSWGTNYSSEVVYLSELSLWHVASKKVS